MLVNFLNKVVDKCEVITFENKDDWAKFRVGKITGSSAWLLGTGRFAELQETISDTSERVDNIAMEIGRELEAMVIRHACPDAVHIGGSELVTLVSKQNQNWIANIDGFAIVDGEPVLIEAKTTLGKWKDIPERYYWQVQWYMFLTGVKKTILNALVLSRREFLRFEIEADPSAQNAFIENYAVFERVLSGELRVAKSVEDAEPEFDRQPLTLGDEKSELLDEYAQVTEQIKALEQRQSALRQSILEIAQDAGKSFLIGRNAIAKIARREQPVFTIPPEVKEQFKTGTKELLFLSVERKK